MVDNKKIDISSSSIKKARMKQKMSREMLSIKLTLEGLSISKQTIYKIENNKRKLKSNEILVLTKILKLDNKRN